MIPSLTVFAAICAATFPAYVGMLAHMLTAADRRRIRALEAMLRNRIL